MSPKKLDASQGVASNAARPIGPARRIALPNGKAIIAGAGRDVARADRESTTPRSSTERTTQDFRRG
jgi:hypothetical protein